MNKIVIGFSKPKKWMPFAWAIMKVYDIPYDHVFIKLYSTKYDRYLVYQASKTMVNFMGLDTFLHENEVIKDFELDVTPENEIKLLQFAIDNAGKPYGFLEALGLGIVRLLSLMGIKVSNPFRDDYNSFVCSELAAYILKNFIETDYAVDPESTSPLDLYEYLTR